MSCELPWTAVFEVFLSESDFDWLGSTSDSVGDFESTLRSDLLVNCTGPRILELLSVSH